MTTHENYTWLQRAAAAWYRAEQAKFTKPRLRLLTRSDVAPASQAHVISGHTAKKPRLSLVRVEFSKKDD